MEKLELKHIVGYLPYGLKLYDIYINVTYKTAMNCEILDYLINSNSECVKPILRPLSGLTKEIEVNGEKFVPMDKLAKIEEIVCLRYALEFFETSSDYLPFWIIKKLYEWHFDLHSLIEKNLAIDINTIDNGIQ